MNRRRFLQAGGRGVTTVGIAKALHNTVVGYGTVGIGENLTNQSIESLLIRDLRLPVTAKTTVGDTHIKLDTGSVAYRDGDQWRKTDAENTPNHIAEFACLLSAVDSGAVAIRILSLRELLTPASGLHYRPGIVEVLRSLGTTGGDPATVERLTGADPEDSKALIMELVGAFARTGRYDVARYLAGSLEDNLLPVETDLRARFERKISLEVLARTDEPVGLFCSELAWLAMNAIQAVRPHDQTVPLVATYVRNRRHKHAYNALLTVVERSTPSGPAVELQLAFADYTETTLLDAIPGKQRLETELDAYDTHHRADNIIWIY